MEKNIEIAKIYHECFGASYRIVQCYFRYMIKKYKLGFFDHSISPYCPHHFQYVKHIYGILLLSKTHLKIIKIAFLIDRVIAGK